MATWSNTNRASASFTNEARSLRTYGDLDNTEIGLLDNLNLINGKAVGDYANSDAVGPIWAGDTRSTAAWSNETRN